MFVFICRSHLINQIAFDLHDLLDLGVKDLAVLHHGAPGEVAHDHHDLRLAYELKASGDPPDAKLLLKLLQNSKK